MALDRGGRRPAPFFLPDTYVAAHPIDGASGPQRLNVPHRHLIREDDPPAMKSALGDHIDKWHTPKG